MLKDIQGPLSRIALWVILGVASISASEKTTFSMEQAVFYWEEASFENEMILEHDLGHSVIGTEFAQLPGDISYENELMATVSFPIFDNLSIVFPDKL